MIYTKTFDCGAKMAFKRTRSDVSYCALAIKSGTRDEGAALEGMAHMTEHMLFKGTLRRSSQSISNRLERLGGDLNAYTSKEETVLYATVLKEDTAKAVDLLAELAFTSVFSEKELEKERLVVIDEINMCKDSPSESIFDDFEQLLFGEHPLGRTILGTAKSLKKMTSDDIRSYVSARFTPSNMCFSLVGNLTPARAEKIVSDVLTKYRCPSAAGQKLDTRESLAYCAKSFTKEVNKHNHQTNCIIGTAGLSYYDPDRMALTLLANILGGPSTNSRLNQALRERNALVYSIEAIYTPYSDTGSFLICFGCEKPNLSTCIELIHRELRTLRDTPLTPFALRAAKKQLLGQLAISSDNGEVQALSMGKSMMVFGHILSDEEARAKIMDITSEQLQEVACRVLAEDKLSTLIYK